MSNSDSSTSFIYYFDHKHWTKPIEIVFLTTLALNTACMPFIIFYAKKKIKTILNPTVNKSVSKISISILALLMLQAVFVLLNSISLIAVIIHYQVKYSSYDDYLENHNQDTDSIIISHLHHTAIRLSEYGSSALTIFQTFEWGIMINMIRF